MSRLHRGRRNLRKLLEDYAAERGFTADDAAATIPTDADTAASAGQEV